MSNPPYFEIEIHSVRYIYGDLQILVQRWVAAHIFPARRSHRSEFLRRIHPRIVGSPEVNSCRFLAVIYFFGPP